MPLGNGGTEPTGTSSPVLPLGFQEEDWSAVQVKQEVIKEAGSATYWGKGDDVNRALPIQRHTQNAHLGSKRKGLYKHRGNPVMGFGEGSDVLHPGRI